MAHDPEIVQMNIKDPEIAAHQVTILPTDGVVVCNEKLHRVGSLLDSGHTLAAHLGLFEGVPDYTPDSLAVEGMKPEEKRAWSWWSRLEASEVGSGSRQLPPLDIDRDRAPVPSTASGNKSSVAQKTPALELLYGLPPGTLSAEHVAFFLRPSNAAAIVRLKPVSDASLGDRRSANKTARIIDTFPANPDSCTSSHQVPTALLVRGRSRCPLR